VVVVIGEDNNLSARSVLVWLDTFNLHGMNSLLTYKNLSVINQT